MGRKHIPLFLLSEASMACCTKGKYSTNKIQHLVLQYGFPYRNTNDMLATIIIHPNPSSDKPNITLAAWLNETKMMGITSHVINDGITSHVINDRWSDILKEMNACSAQLATLSEALPKLVRRFASLQTAISELQNAESNNGAVDGEN
jgi:hypothetical protein